MPESSNTPPPLPLSRGGELGCTGTASVSSKTTIVFFLIAGEASGDVLGARLMRALRQKTDNKACFVGIGGPLMVAEGLDLLFPHTELMHFGLVEVVRHLPRLLRRIRETADAVIDLNPDALISIDAPDFSFWVARRVRKQGTGNREHKSDNPAFLPIARSPFPVPPCTTLIHYIAPTVWAWRPGRAKKIALFLDHLLAAFPFEPPYFICEGLPCTFVGHSVVESGVTRGNAAVFCVARNIPFHTTLLTVLPGSRASEIARLLPIFREAVKIIHERHPDMHIIVPTVPHLKHRVAADIATWGVPFHIVESEKDKYDALAASRAALACSGTVTLELALAKVPHVIAYKVNALSAFLFRHLARVSFVNLINLMHNKLVVPELLQKNCTSEKLAEGIDVLLADDKARQEQIAALAATASWLGQGQFVPSERAAETVLSAIENNRRPAVLQVLPALVTGGVERGTVEMTAALVKNGFRAFVASSGGPMVAEIEASGGVHIPLPLASKNPLTIISNITRLSAVIRAKHISIVHARSRAPAWSAYYAAARCRVPFITTFHSAYGAGSWIKRLYNSVMAKGARVIAISNFVASYAERTYGVSRQIMRVIPRGVDVEAFDPMRVDPARVDALRAAWKIPSAVPVILMPGRLTRWKGQSVLIAALSQLKQDFFCIIVGGGTDSPYADELRREILTAKLDEKICIVDTCRDMAAAYQLVDVVVVPSTRPEGFGRVVIEAQAMGKPVIASNHGGAAESVIQGETGWLTKPGDPEALGQALAKVLRLPLLQKQALATKARAHVKQNFTTESMTLKTLAIYKDVIGHLP